MGKENSNSIIGEGKEKKGGCNRRKVGGGRIRRSGWLQGIGEKKRDGV
jgi:hypothetical protein